MLLLLSARTIVSSSARRVPVILGAVVLLATMGFGAADQQLAKSNPRDYDFRSALRTISLKVRPGDTWHDLPAGAARRAGKRPRRSTT
jgi:hypothetical protein